MRLLSGAPRWYEVHANLVALVRWMVESEAYTKDDIAYAVEKPWKYEPEARRAGVEIEEDQ